MHKIFLAAAFVVACCGAAAEPQVTVQQLQPLSTIPTVSTTITRSMAAVPQVSFEADEDKEYRCSGIQVGIRWVLTAKHCLPPEGVKTDMYVNGQLARLVKQNDAFALLETSKDAQWIFPIRKEPLKIGEQFTAYGYAYGIGDVPHVLTRILAYIDKSGHLVFDGTFIHGMSGGPIVDKDGKVVGVIQQGTPEVGIACNAKEIAEFIK